MHKPKGEGYVYVLKSLDLYKIGMTVFSWNNGTFRDAEVIRRRRDAAMKRTLYRRIASYRTHNPHGIELLDFAFVRDSSSLETLLHEKFSDSRITGEWFRLSETDLKKVRKILHV